MSVWGNSSEAPDEREVTITRVYDAPARLVFKAWSVPEHVMKWFGPEGWPLTMAEIDFRVGGHYRFAMTGPDGAQNTPFGGEYFEIRLNERIVFDNGFEVPDSLRMLWTVTFDESQGKTTLKVHTLFWSVAMKEEYVGLGFLIGLGPGLDQLEGVIQALNESERR